MELTEIRWHGRGGQGAVTAAKFVAEAALAEGKEVQAFPEYGPERMGAPIQAFTRISEAPIRAYYGVMNPEVVVVLDPTILDSVDVTHGLLEDGVLLVNTKQPPGEIRDKLKLKKGRVSTVDATIIALETLGKAIPNTPMIGALVRVTGILDLEKMIEHFQSAFAHKFSSQVIQGNVEAIRRAHEEVRLD